MIAAATTRNNIRLCPLKRVRTGYRSWGVDRKDFYTGHNMIRFISVHPTLLSGQIVFSKPRIFEVARGSPEVLHQDRIFPILLIKTQYSTGYNTYPLMEVWCVNHEYDAPDQFFKFPDAIKDSLRYILNIMSGRAKHVFPLPEDAMVLVRRYLTRDDISNLTMTCRTLNSLGGIFLGDARYRTASFSNVEAKYIAQFEPPPPIMFNSISSNSVFTWRNLTVFYRGKNPLLRPELQFLKVSGETFRQYTGHRIVDLNLDFGLHAETSKESANPQVVRRVSLRNRYQFTDESANIFAETNESYYAGLPYTSNWGKSIKSPDGSSVPVTEIPLKSVDHNYDISDYPEDPPGSSIVHFHSPMVLDTIVQPRWSFTKRKRMKYS